MNGSHRLQVSGCKNGNCAKVYLAGDRAFVQGTLDAEGELHPPAGEAVVEIPMEVLLEAAKEVLA